MKLLKNKKFYLSILIDFSFLAVLYFFVLFIFKKIRDYAFTVQEFGANLKEIENVVQENISLLDYNMLLGNVEVMNSAIQRIMFFFFIFLAGSFILYCLFQGVQWFVTTNSKNFKKYLWKFSLVSLFSVSISLYLIWNILLKVKPLFLNYLEGISVFGLGIKVILLIILILILWYFTSICYVFLGKYNLIQTLKRMFLFKGVIGYLASVVLVFLVVFLFLRFNLQGFYLIIELILIVGIINYYRYYLKSEVL